MPTSPTSPPPLPGRPLAATPCVRPRPLAQRRGKWSRKPRPGRLLGSGGRKSRLSCSRRRRRRCRCCCSWCSELRGSESRLRPFPAAAMKWMFKEDHSLGKRLAPGGAVGTGAAVSPLPHSGRPGLGPAGWMPRALGSGGRGPAWEGGPHAPEPPRTPPPRAAIRRLCQEPGDRAPRPPGLPNRSPWRAQVAGGGGPGPRDPARGQARPSAPCVCPTEHRCVESAKIRAKYPDRVPVIVEKVSGSQIVDIDKRKYLVPSDITVAQFMWIIRKRIQLPSEKAIFLFVDKTVPQSSLTMGQLYEKEKDEDGFLYVAYSGENTFGF
uniref:Gamma-aminobutyric acid receptor-associated protein-like 2 n=1 Tax=Equus asinus TaxID=9793 RepID=A0A9L0KF86_EQUAS